MLYLFQYHTIQCLLIFCSTYHRHPSVCFTEASPYIWCRDPGRIPLGNSENLDLNQLRIRVACLICLIARGNPGMAEKKKVKNLIKFRDSHRNFVRKTIAEAKDLISGGNPIEVRKLKLLRTSLQTKCSELQVLDRDIVELLGGSISAAHSSSGILPEKRRPDA